MRLFRRYLLLALTIVLASLPACPKSVMAMTDRVTPSISMEMMAGSMQMSSCDGARFDGSTPACCLFHGGDSTSDRVKSATVPQALDVIVIPTTECPPVAYPEYRRPTFDRSNPATEFFERNTNQRE